jgi:hypothetical protein
VNEGRVHIEVWVFCYVYLSHMYILRFVEVKTTYHARSIAFVLHLAECHRSTARGFLFVPPKTQSPIYTKTPNTLSRHIVSSSLWRIFFFFF